MRRLFDQSGFTEDPDAYAEVAADILVFPPLYALSAR